MFFVFFNPLNSLGAKQLLLLGHEYGVFFSITAEQKNKKRIVSVCIS